MRGRLFRRLIIAAAIVVTGLAAAEITASLFLPASGVTNPDLYIPDAARGSALRPGFKETIVRAGHSFEVSINSNGYRDDEWPLQDPRPRVLLVGSSAAFGVGLSHEQSLAGQLERDLAPKILAFNTATYTYGPISELPTILRECPTVHPFLVLYLHEYKNTRADFLVPRPTSGPEEPDPQSERRWGVTLPALRTLLSDHFLHPRQIVERLVGLDRLPHDYLERYAQTIGPDYAPENAARAAALIREMAAAAQQCGAKFQMAVLPGPAEAYYGLREPATEALLAALRSAGMADDVIDTRSGIPLGSRLFLTAHDYPNAAGAAYLAGAIAPHAAAMLETQP
ncbi:MAG: hypothetical protein JO255_00350 [Alphaproteobacteria bacterium]|nr:hypothetical protein [Alphaproteobacteria bacterium]